MGVELHGRGNADRAVWSGDLRSCPASGGTSTHPGLVGRAAHGLDHERRGRQGPAVSLRRCAAHPAIRSRRHPPSARILRRGARPRASLVDWGLRALPSTGILAKFLAWLARFSARRLARNFIAGTNHEKPCGLSPRMRRRNLAFTVDLLGEATITEREADAIAGGIPRTDRRPEPRRSTPGRRTSCIDRDAGGPVAARQRLGQAVVAVQPVRSDRSRGHQRGRAAPAAAHPSGGPPAAGLRQLRHGAVRLQGPDAAHLSRHPRRGRVPRLARRRHRHSGLPARHGPRPRRAAPVGASGAARPCGCGWSRAPTGTTRRSWPSSRVGRSPSGSTNGRPTPPTNG